MAEAPQVEQTERQRRAWLALDALLAEIHSRPTEYSAEQIEAEITAARLEVKAQRRALRLKYEIHRAETG
jgi:ribosomal protein S7